MAKESMKKRLSINQSPVQELISMPVASRCEIPQFSLQVQLCLRA